MRLVFSPKHAAKLLRVERCHTSITVWCPTCAVVLQAGGHLLCGRFIPEWATHPGLAAGGLKATGHPGIITGAGSTLLLGAGEGKASITAPCLPHKSGTKPSASSVCSEGIASSKHAWLRGVLAGLKSPFYKQM